MRPFLLAFALATAFGFPAAQAGAATSPSPGELLTSAPADAWADIPADQLILMDLPGNRRIAIQLAPQFAPQHVENIRRLIAADWFRTHAAIVRVQDNYVVQWGDPSEKQVLPAGLILRPEGGYERPGPPPDFRALPYRDAYAPQVGHSGNWPVVTDGSAHWLPHCPGTVGAGRNMPPDTGTGAELYVVIGHGPRHLDRNIASVGRVVDGLQYLSSLPRGTGDLGFYTDPAERTGLAGLALASSLAEGARPHYQMLKTDSPAFAAWVKARASRLDSFFVRPAGSADICNLLPPVRKRPG